MAKLKLRKFDSEKARLADPLVNYMGPEKGPFKCGHCEYFNAKGSFCTNDVIQAPVEAEGCCNLYEPLDEDDDDE